MRNPILDRMNNSGTGMMEIINLLQSNSPEDALRIFASRNPRFNEFVEKNKGKTLEQICRDYGLDPERAGQLIQNVSRR